MEWGLYSRRKVFIRTKAPTMVLCAVIFNIIYHVLTASSPVEENSLTSPDSKYISGNNTDLEAALQFLAEDDKLAAIMGNKQTKADWNYETNLTEANKMKMIDVSEEFSKFKEIEWKIATSFAWKDFKGKNETIYRWFKDLSLLGIAALPPEKRKQYKELIASMQEVYGKAKICPYNSRGNSPCNLALEPELTQILKESHNYDELQYVWHQWREVSGKRVKKQFETYVEISNEAAHLNGFPDMGAFWREVYESDTFQSDLEELFQIIKPFYQQLHAYVRRKLINFYGQDHIRPDGPIPAHLMGNMWSQTWENILDLVKPYPNKKGVDVTQTMKNNKMTPLDMFKLAEQFFISLGLHKMTPEFWKNSIIEKPKDREIICHASAYEFYDGKDFRIKMCTEVNMEDLITIHHEMGHIQYYQQYSVQPIVFRNGANPGFHEAVGDVMALSVSTQSHLKKIGLLKNYKEDKETDLNFLMNMALNKIAFLPFGYLIDSWRWSVFNGTFQPQEYNQKWWDLRLKYQGICPPVERTNEDLDPAAKYHVVADVPYIRYFVSFIMQFQFHKSLCEEAGHQGPLHTCDIYKNKAAGKLLSGMLSLGSSVPWEEALSIFTKGQTNKIDAKPMLEYFAPLLEWLENENKNEFIGWKSDNPMKCPKV